jgi:cob(I)alamin adenosyltransferase
MRDAIGARPEAAAHVKVLKLFAEKSDIDKAITRVQEKKFVINSELMSPILREDATPLVVPDVPSVL